jgi:hypothetical protein
VCQCSACISTLDLSPRMCCANFGTCFLGTGEISEVSRGLNACQCSASIRHWTCPQNVFVFPKCVFQQSASNRHWTVPGTCECERVGLCRFGIAGAIRTGLPSAPAIKTWKMRAIRQIVVPRKHLGTGEISEVSEASTRASAQQAIDIGPVPRMGLM